MELKLFWLMLRRRWWLILIPVVVVAVITLPDLFNRDVTVSGGFNTTIRYSAAQEFNLPNRDGDYQDVWLASELTVNAFTDWVRSSSFLSEIALDVGESIDLNQLGIAADNARSVGVIFLSYPSEDGLQQIAETAINVLVNRNQVYFPQLGGEPAQITLLDEPLITLAPPPIVNRLEPFIRIGIALIAGLMLAFLVEYIDKTIYNRDDLESQGFQVIATIPKYKDA